MEATLVGFSPKQTNMIKKYLDSTRFSDLSDFLSYLIMLNYSSNEIAKFFLSQSIYLDIATNKCRTFIQVGGEILYVFLLAITEKFKQISFYGQLEQVEKEKFDLIANKMSEHNFKTKVNLINEISLNESNVFCVVDENISTELLRSIQFSELLLSKKCIKHHGMAVFTKLFYNKIKKTKYYLAVPASFHGYSDSLNEILINETIYKFIKTSYTHLRFEEKNESYLDEVIDEIHNRFIQIENKGEQFNKFDLKCQVAQLFTEMILTLINLTKFHCTGRLKPLLLEMHQYKFITIVTFYIVFRFHLSALPIGVLYDCCKSMAFKDFLICIQTSSLLLSKKLNEVEKSKIKTSFSQLVETNHEIANVFRILENKEYINIQEEVNHAQQLIPDFILLHDNILSFSGKTLLGGIISLSKNSFYSKSQNIRDAVMLMAIRHEISHKKLLINTSKKYSTNFPERPSCTLNEAGICFDRLAYGEFEESCLFDLTKVDENIAEKVLAGKKLEEDQVKVVFNKPVPVTRQVEKGMLKPGCMWNLKMLCNGRNRCK